MPTTLEGQAQYAHSRGAAMATLTSPGENQFVMGFLQQPGEVNGMFFGLSRTGPLGAWTWSDGQPLGWSFWGGPSCAFGPYPNNAGQPGEWVGIYYLQNCGPVWDDAPPLWYTDSSANVRLLLEWSADCNGDGVVDYGQIRSGAMEDVDADGVPDCCGSVVGCCPGDLFVDRKIDGADLGVLLAQWGAASSGTVADLNADGVVDGADLGVLLAGWGACPL